MTMSKGTFKVRCDEPGCDEEVDLETEDFNEAIRVKHDMCEGWGTFHAGNRRYEDYCPLHLPYENRAIRKNR